MNLKAVDGVASGSRRRRRQARRIQGYLDTTGTSATAFAQNPKPNTDSSAAADTAARSAFLLSIVYLQTAGPVLPQLDFTADLPLLLCLDDKIIRTEIKLVLRTGPFYQSEVN